MIDRKAFRISGLILLAMITATLWRLSLLPDWQHIPVGNPAHHRTVNGLFLFAGPVSLLIMMAVPFIPKWLMTPQENLPAWQRWNGKWIISWSVVMALLQGFVLARSFHLGPVMDGRMMAQMVLLFIGIVLMMTGNSVPKAPLPPAGFYPHQLNPWQANRQLRFIGKLLFGVGLAIALGGILLPMEFWQPAFLCLSLAALAAAIWSHIRLRRETAPLP